MVLAQSLVGRRDIEAAARIIEELLALQPQVLEFRTRLAALYLALDAPDRAEAVLRAGVERYPESTEAKLALVSFLRGKRGDDVAEAELSKLIRNRPDDYDLRFIMADFYLATGRDENAEAVYRQVLEIGDEGPKIDKARLSPDEQSAKRGGADSRRAYCSGARRSRYRNCPISRRPSRCTTRGRGIKTTCACTI
jgi:tetratricopeptide (TPR) repeat protein